jgi:predicted AAA+ superfamily ATPase
LYFYRDTEKREVDVVIESLSGDVAAVETKAAAGVSTADIRGLELLRGKLGSRFKAGGVIYSGENTLKMSDRVWAVPLAGLWQSGVTSSKGEAS